jgi:copper chaperone CopZ
VSACDKAESTETAPAKVEVAANTAAAHTAAAHTAAEGEEACAGDDGEEHSGADCMKKSAEMGEGMGCNQWDEAAAAVNKKEIPADAKWQVLKVEGMTCGGCERRIIANVGALEGVVAVEADSELGQVRVAVASGHEDASKAARTKIDELGYKVQ